jgi:hypothetical protein
MKASIIEAHDILLTLSARGMEKWSSNLPTFKIEGNL